MKVSVQLSLGKYSCAGCSVEMWWVLWMRAISPEPADWVNAWHGDTEEYFESGKDFAMPVVIEQSGATETARTLLRELNLDSRARQLVDRPPGLRGASYNPNRCPRCAHVADWDMLEHLVIEAAHHQHALWRLRPVEVSPARWAYLIEEQHSIRGF
ncbi:MULTISPECIES: hypothetical protein [Clavibacter]|uniref:Uncharacterized protein n=2 Tax=Clavibacter TaxID=1573 RepID=A0A399NYS0_9MICO|nr:MULTISPECIES: hypothetical protein [Clavibacter]KDP89784.1 hypothetical protein W824_14925 [Clavibacter cf. michiganensis LMG 26808]RII99064.1 hypothetical protein DZF96_00010 [Clavibacter michiganensis]UKF26680.1 hypothetical protein KYT88_15805 [Clavibacter sp. A6099]